MEKVGKMPGGIIIRPNNHNRSRSVAEQIGQLIGCADTGLRRKRAVNFAMNRKRIVATTVHNQRVSGLG